MSQTPLFSFGIAADVQYADKDDDLDHGNFYRFAIFIAHLIFQLLM